MKGHVFALTFLTLFLVSATLIAQKPAYSHADSLKGGISKERAWWDVQHYELRVKFNLPDSTLSGSNRITYKVLTSHPLMQIDLMQPMIIDSVIQDSKQCIWKRDGNAFFVTLAAEQKQGDRKSLFVYFHGKPRAAKNAPWDGGV